MNLLDLLPSLWWLLRFNSQQLRKSFTELNFLHWSLLIFTLDLQSLLQLHALASQHNDPALQDFLEGEFLKEQVESISHFAHYVTQTKRAGTGLGEYLFDKLTLSDWTSGFRSAKPNQSSSMFIPRPYPSIVNILTGFYWCWSIFYFLIYIISIGFLLCTKVFHNFDLSWGVILRYKKSGLKTDQEKTNPQQIKVKSLLREFILCRKNALSFYHTGL